jgi:hypothetical protein
MTPMKKTQVYLPDEDLAALREVAERTGRSMAELIRQAIREKWLSPGTGVGPVALWDGTPSRTSVDHDSVYDEP